MKNLIEIINEISEEAKNKFKPDLVKYGKNFRAISESAILEVLNPLFKTHGIAYQILIEKSELKTEKIACGRDSGGNLIEKLVFVALVGVKLIFVNPAVTQFNNPDKAETFVVDGIGSGIDYGDKATGKAYTGAVKYALLKGLRLQYSDDPDAETSEEIENIVGEPSKAAETGKAPKQSKEKAAKKDEGPKATEAQLNYLKGLAIACEISDEEFKNKYGFLPYDANMPMRRAREIIDELKKIQEAKLPF